MIAKKQSMGYLQQGLINKNMMTNTALNEIRNEIDKLDQELLQLINKRLQLVSKVGTIKHKEGIPVYAPDREASMLKSRRIEAEKLGIAPQLIEDILRRLMRESYFKENDSGYKQSNPNVKSVVIIGGLGQLGKLFGRMFTLSGYHVKTLDKDDWEDADKIFKDCSLALVSVPIDVTPQVIEKLSNLPADCILADLTSVKTIPLETMLKVHRGPVVGLHPMFGPDVNNFAKQVIVVCKGRKSANYAWLLEQFSIWGVTLVYEDANDHDKAMRLIQAMRHFSTFIYGSNLCNSKTNISQLLSLSSPIYRLEIAMVGRLFAQDPNLYADIIFSQKENIDVIEDYLQVYKNGINLIKSGDKNEFINEFNKIATWFGDYADQFLQESRQMLLSVNDMKK